MKQYLDLLSSIKENGTYKPAARSGMPGTQSLFGYQFKHDLSKGFPLLTTKKMYWKGVVVELIWFLRGDTNIKYLVDNKVKIWNEDAYNYYCKSHIGGNNSPDGNDILKFVPPGDPNHDKVFPEGFYTMLKLDEFIDIIKNTPRNELPTYGKYTLGDCGYQYGKVWRNWEILDTAIDPETNGDTYWRNVDQIKNVIESLKNNPESRRHLVTALDPTHDTDLALYWCHAMFQFNCRPLTNEERQEILDKSSPMAFMDQQLGGDDIFTRNNIPKYYLDCQLYQRSADVVLGVPFNIASYALLTEILAKICNMIPGEFVHTFGDVHIYDNHKEAVTEQLQRTPTALPKLDILLHMKDFTVEQFDWWSHTDFEIRDYNPQDKIDAKLSTGL